MPLLVSLILLCLCPVARAGAGNRFFYRVLGNDPGSWPAIFSAIGLTRASGGSAGIVIAPTGTPAADWPAHVNSGTILILQGESPLAASYGFHPSTKQVTVRSVEDLRAPKLRIVYEKALAVSIFNLPKQARVFARERWQGAPLMAGFRQGQGAVLWLAAPPGPSGYDRFPYLLQALADLGFAPPFRSRDLWAFFDSSYRTHVDLDYFAPKWRAAGIAALHVAAWHFWERDPQSDEYLRRLIEACHRNGILVYAWLEFPHVSDKFWDQHPEWREKTALLQDAQLDWRKLMNLTGQQASQAVAAGLRDLMQRFDWDGVNLAELYFESLEGYEDPARFTPMNDDVRAEFQRAAGFDPHNLFDPRSPRYLAKNTRGLKQFLDFRADLAARQQAEWIDQVEQIRKTKPYLDLVLTHVDDRFDPSMREKIGADVSRVLPMLEQHDFTFLIEDPATLWNLGPRRYPQIAARYTPLTPRQDKLAIDINVVERYQDVYPTKQQTGSELFQLVHQAAMAFPRVALYFENSLAPPDLPLLPSAAAAVEHVARVGSKLAVESRREVGVRWQGPALVDGKPWPAVGGDTIWLPAGAHSIETAPSELPLRLADFNGKLKTAAADPGGGIEFSYESSARALAILNHPPSRARVDGADFPVPPGSKILVLPRGQHIVDLN